MEKLVGWVKPNSGWVKLNTDGASKGNPCPAGAGGIFRDEAGNWLGGFMNSLGVATSMCAELGAIRSGLELAWSRGFTKLLVESDSLSTISILKRTEPANSKWVRHHIDAIWDLLRKPWCVRFVHVYREANKCAVLAGKLCYHHAGRYACPGCCSSREKLAIVSRHYWALY